MSIDLVMLSNHLILCFLLILSLFSPSIRAFSNELALYKLILKEFKGGSQIKRIRCFSSFRMFQLFIAV